MDFLSGPYTFIIFLNIIFIGYFVIEVLFGEKYPFKDLLKKYNNHLFDRLTHYLIVGFISNFLFLIFLVLFQNYLDNNTLTALTASLDKIYAGFAILGETGKQVGIVASGIAYFIYFSFVVGITYMAIKGGIGLGEILSEAYNKIFSKKLKSKKKALKKSKKK